MILVTGGAGFIGRHLVRRLLNTGHRILVLDSFEPVVHGTSRLNEAPTIVGHVEDPESCRRALRGVDTVVHLAASVSVGKSAHQPARFVRANSLGTAVLWEEILHSGSIEHVVVASSMSVYGEGGEAPVREEHNCNPRSLYGWTKYDTERISLLCGEQNNIPVTALRFFNVYGPEQSLSNAETGVVAIFASRILAGKPPVVYEDGKQLRDFVHVLDVVEAIVRAVESRSVGVYNVGTGVATEVGAIATQLCVELDSKTWPVITGERRQGDVRYCWANTERAEAQLGFRARIPLNQGLKDYVTWLRDNASQSVLVPHCMQVQ